MALLEIKDLSIEINTADGPLEIISEVEFKMAEGEKLGIVGESGCGKSITALAIMALLPPNSTVKGQILLKDQNLLDLSPKQMCKVRGDRIAMIFQEPMTALNPVKTIGAQIAESLFLHMKIRKKEAIERVEKLMGDVGLPVSRFPLNLYPHQLSGGQRQRIMIAIAIACEPDLLIADEPTTALDVTVQEQILDLIVELADKSGMGLIMISHDLGVIAQTTESVMVMYTGNMVEKGKTVDVFKNMTHPYTNGLFAAIPQNSTLKIDGKKRLFSIPGQVPELHLRTKGCNFYGRCPRHSDLCQAKRPVSKTIKENHHVWCFHPMTGEDKKWEDL